MIQLIILMIFLQLMCLLAGLQSNLLIGSVLVISAISSLTVVARTAYKFWKGE